MLSTYPGLLQHGAGSHFLSVSQKEAEDERLSTLEQLQRLVKSPDPKEKVTIKALRGAEKKRFEVRGGLLGFDRARNNSSTALFRRPQAADGQAPGLSRIWPLRAR